MLARATFSSLPPSPKTVWAGGELWGEADARSSLGLGVGVRGTHLAYIYIYAGGVAADVSSQPALPISKNNLGRLDTRLLRALYEIPLSAFLNAHHSGLTKANQTRTRSTVSTPDDDLPRGKRP